MKLSRKPSFKPRNGHLAQMLFRKKGAHGQSPKALRRDVKVETLREARRLPQDPRQGFGGEPRACA